MPLLFGLLLLVSCGAPAVTPPALDAALPGDVATRADRAPADASAAREAARPPDLGGGPPYPIVLVHGWFGFEKIGPLDYFYGVKPALEADGHRVVIATLDPFNGLAVRGKQLLGQVQAALAATGSARVNLLAHSQGGVDARWVASQLPSRIGAVLTVATPHLGDRLADAMLGKAPGFTVALAQALAAALGRPVWGDLAKDPDLEASFQTISTEGMTAFNQACPDLPEVSYFSVGGRSNLSLAEQECYAPKAPSFISKYDQVRDTIEPLLFLTAEYLGGSLLDPEPNDGVVATASMKWGTWLGCVPADHFDEIGQLFGDSPGIGNSFDHVAFYRDLAAFLVARGF